MHSQMRFCIVVAVLKILGRPITSELRPARLAPTTVSHLKSLKSPFFHILMLSLNLSRSPCDVSGRLFCLNEMIFLERGGIIWYYGSTQWPAGELNSREAFPHSIFPVFQCGYAPTPIWWETSDNSFLSHGIIQKPSQLVFCPSTHPPDIPLITIFTCASTCLACCDHIHLMLPFQNVPKLLSALMSVNIL